MAQWMMLFTESLIIMEKAISVAYKLVFAVSNGGLRCISPSRNRLKLAR
ncbi:hypothetical protein O9993_11960 [Vibrio lentus]|nr:hypothetical protein [Vibrio lentus]